MKMKIIIENENENHNKGIFFPREERKNKCAAAQVLHFDLKQFAKNANWLRAMVLPTLG